MTSGLRVPSDDFLVSRFFPPRVAAESVLFLRSSRSRVRIFLTVCNRASSHLTEVPEFGDFMDVAEIVDGGRNEDDSEVVEEGLWAVTIVREDRFKT